MKGLPLLIRLARQAADAQRLAVAAAERARLAQEAAVAEHAAELVREAARASGDAAEMALWSLWLRGAQRQGQALQAGLLQLQQAEEAEREALRADFAHLKRLELALEQHRTLAARGRARLQEQRAEELALQQRRG